MHYIFVDYENVQPAHLTPLMDLECEIYIFVGALQNKLPVSLVTQMQVLGPRVKYIQISTTAKDALDFHIAFYIGEVAATDESGHFHILSNDKGYDPLITHLKSRNIKISRRGFKVGKPTPTSANLVKTQVKQPATIKKVKTVQKPKAKAPAKLSTQQKIHIIKKCLKDTQPETEKKLKTFIKTQLQISKDAEAQNLINYLRNKKYLVGRNADISYPALAN